MKLFLFTMIISAFSFTSLAQKAELPKDHKKPIQGFSKHSYIFSIGIGLADHYRMNYPVPDSFVKNQTLGMSPLYIRAEYALTIHIGIVAGFGYDQFIYSYERANKYSYRGNTPIPSHTYSDKMILSTLAVSANYHFTKLFKSTKLDPYAGLGISLTRKEDNYYGDKRNTTTDNIGMIAHLGIRYYVDKKIGFNFQVGYDGISVANLGFSYRLL
ncbi:MAG: outer membrane beta-barrel protein [Bacteroidetes bacterium]|nr:outer membrane beta-barrel protein [Bacteroidota bacterium]